MNGPAETGGDQTDREIQSVRLPLRWRRLQAANDNAPPLSRRLRWLAGGLILSGLASWLFWR